MRGVLEFLERALIHGEFGQSSLLVCERFGDKGWLAVVIDVGCLVEPWKLSPLGPVGY
nr:hypothetical protein [Delftia acidovorans]